MSPGTLELLARAREAQQPASCHRPRHPASDAPSAPADALPSIRSADSWIDISSRHSSSSLSSAHEDVVTNGLRVQDHPQRNASSSTTVKGRRRRRAGPISTAQMRLSLGDRTASAEGSSQEEYEESESESDRVMTSSNEAAPPFAPSPLSRHDSSAPSDNTGDEDDDEARGDGADESATALDRGTNDNDVFTPQPNAFSHPPSSHSRSPGQAGGSYFPAAHSSAAKANSRSTSFHLRRKDHPPHNAISQSHKADHDAALKASLSTLLSCAAAARGLPKHDRPPSGTQSTPKHDQRLQAQPPPPPSREVAPTRADANDAETAPRRRRNRSRSSTRSAKTSPERRGSKREAARSTSKERRAVKRLRCVGVDEAISPTLMTWVVSAGVIVLVGALSFSAGYSAGRDQGRLETLSANGSGDGAARECGRQARGGMGLRRRLWSGVGRAVAA